MGGACAKRAANFLTPWEPTWPSDDLTRGAFRRRLKRYAEDQRNDLAYAFMIFRNEDNALVGGLTLANIRRGVAQAGSIGYWVGEPFARKGYMTAAVRALIPFCFGTLRLHRLEAACIPGNAASVAAAGKDRLHARGLCPRLFVHQRHLAGPPALCPARRRSRINAAFRVPWACHAWLAIRGGTSPTKSVIALKKPKKKVSEKMRGERTMRSGASMAGLLGLALALGGCGGNLLGRSSNTNIFGSSKATTGQPAAGVARREPTSNARSIDVRTGAATLMIGSKPGAAESNRRRSICATKARIIRTARECHLNAGIMTMKVGIEGRVITGPAGGPGNVDVPLRIAVVKEGPEPKTIVSKFARIPVTIAGAVDRVVFTHVDSDIAFPMPTPAADIDAYVVYVGFELDGVAGAKKAGGQAEARKQAEAELSEITSRAGR